MAPQKSPHPAATLPSQSRPAIKASGATPATSLTPRDIDQAKEDALLQLKIGRSSHYYAVIVSGALLFDALLVLFFPPDLSGGAPHDLHSLYFLLFPLFGGVYLAAFGLQIKWEDYQLWPWEPHFSLTVASVGVDVLLAYLYLADLFQYGPTGHWSLLPWFYALTLVGVMLPLVALALTWSEWSSRKVISLGAAIAPVPVAFALYLPTLGGSSQVYALAFSLSASAVLFQMAGSFLHLIASGTRTHEREVITSGQNRLFQVAGELRKREEAMQFREATLVRREADVDNAETSLRRKLEALEESRRHTIQLESDVEKRAAAVTVLQRDLAVKTAETNARARLLEDKDAALKLREQDVALRLPKLSDREKALLEREGALVEKTAETDARTQEFEAKSAELAGLEERLGKRQTEIDQKTAELIGREGEIAQKAPAPGAEAQGPVPRTRAEQARLTALGTELDQRSTQLEAKAAEAKAILAQAEQNRRESARMVEALRVREAEVERREHEAADRLALSESRIGQYDTAVRGYEEKTQAAEARTAELDHQQEDVTRRERTLSDRTAHLDTREGQLRQQRSELEALEHRLNVQAKRLGSIEDELRYRDQALSHRGPGEGGFSLAFAAAGDHDAAPSLRPGRRRGPVPVEPADIIDESEEPPRPRGHGERFLDRVPMGTPRLDDLLLGGLPPRGHVMLIGDAFVEKEIAVYAYLAEGLKRGEPVIVLTAARGPEELSQRIGLVAPQFHDYEGLGMVRWIDSSIPEGAPAARPSTETRTTTHGPQDLPGVLSALVKALNTFSKEPDKTVRVAYLGLSATLAHLDERQRLQFIQNIVGVLKPRNALALYTLETGTLPDSQMETILSRLDGAIYFKRDQDKSFLCVQGLGEVQTRQWVEYRATNRALVIGSFALERIR